MKSSRQRDAVYEALCGTKLHPTAAEVYEKVRQVMPDIGIATVYRNLSRLSENGKALALRASDGVIHYDACTDPHSHFFCNRCRRVLDIDLPLTADITADDRYEVERYEVMFYGTCRECL